MSILFYSYNKCQSCVKARKWLVQNKLPFKEVPIVEKAPTQSQLKKYWKASGLELKKFFNSSGQVYRELKLSQKLKELSAAEQISLLASHGKLIKRPLLVSDQKVLLGFKVDEYKTLL